VSVLEAIAVKVRARVEARRGEPAVTPAREPLPFAARFARPGVHVIAEIKRASPALGVLAPGADAGTLARDYAAHGAAAISVLTEQDHFHGSLADLRAARAAAPSTPLLMKDFVVDELQLHEARRDGADAVLLIVALLGEPRLGELLSAARALNLEALVEVHDERELESARAAGATLVGINNRDLRTLAVSLETSRRLAPRAAPGMTLISESGLSTGAELRELRGHGFSGFLIGGALMQSGAPGEALARLIEEAR